MYVQYARYKEKNGLRMDVCMYIMNVIVCIMMKKEGGS